MNKDVQSSDFLLGYALSTLAKVRNYFINTENKEGIILIESDYQYLKSKIGDADERE